MAISWISEQYSRLQTSSTCCTKNGPVRNILFQFYVVLSTEMRKLPDLEFVFEKKYFLKIKMLKGLYKYNFKWPSMQR